MDTLKTAVVVVLLLAVLYGVYVVLNKPEQYSQDLAWETGAADPALQIELGVPEPGESGSGSATPPLAAQQPGYLTEAKGAIENHLSDSYMQGGHALGDRPSLPIPEPTTPAAPAIAAPNLIDAPMSPTTNSFAAPTLGSSSSAGGSTGATASPSPPATANDLRDPANGSNSIESPTNRSGESNRYSDYSPLRDPATTEVASQSAAPAPASAEQANVNDLVASEAAVPDGSSFRSVLESVHTKIAAEAWKDALIKLSSYYSDPSLSAAEVTQLVDLLDPLAGKVIYSTEHLIEPAYQSQPGDTLMNVADRYQVPWQLLANVNGIENPDALLTSRELKVVRGPFRAEVSLSKNELTLFVDKLYAGRFAISVGNAPSPLPGQYQINDKQPGRTYYAGNGQTIPIDDPNNPYGRVWLDLGNNLCIHGSSPNGASPGQGCIALTARDAGDVYGILSKGSSIVISR
ncbi:MAG: L,D-transpeptidase family protein [Planctomycetota bacterium]